MRTDVYFLEKSFELADRRFAGAAGTPWTVSTPCTRWTLRRLANHMIALPTMLTRAVRGERIEPDDLSPDKMASRDYFGADPDGAQARGLFTAAADSALAACRAPGALDGAVSMHRGEVPLRVLMTLTLSDITVHSWDMARATDQDPALPDDVAETALLFMSSFLSPGARTGDHPHFAPVVTVLPSASQTDRLVAYLGRTP